MMKLPEKCQICQLVCKAAVIGLVFWLLSLKAVAAETEYAEDEPGIGIFSGEIGINFWVSEADNKDFTDDGSVGFAFAEIGFVSSDFYNFVIGADAIAVGELWADVAFNTAFTDDGIFQKDFLLKSSYISYGIPDTETEILVGRAEFQTSESMDGDSFQGIQISTRDLPGAELYFAVINRWITNASTGYDLDGISKDWLNGGDIGDNVSNTIYSIIAELELIEDVLKISPYYNLQSGALANLGASFEIDVEVDDRINLGLDGTYAIYMEDTDDPADEDAGEEKE